MGAMRMVDLRSSTHVEENGDECDEVVQRIV